MGGPFAFKTKGGKTMEKAEAFLMKAATLLCAAIYRMCKTVLAKDGSERVNDPKFLKEVGAALKEATAVVTGLEKKKEPEKEAIRIVFGTDGGER